jgi:anti-anti-sigma factor
MVAPIEIERVIQVRVTGEIDVAGANLLERVLDAPVGVPLALLVVDLSQVTFLGVAGLEILARAQVQARQTGTRVCVFSGVPAVERALSLLAMWQPELDNCAA